MAEFEITDPFDDDENEQQDSKKKGRTGLLLIEGDLNHAARRVADASIAFGEARRADEEADGNDVERKQLFTADVHL